LYGHFPHSSWITLAFLPEVLYRQYAFHSLASFKSGECPRPPPPPPPFLAPPPPPPPPQTPPPPPITPLFKLGTHDVFETGPSFCPPSFPPPPPSPPSGPPEATPPPHHPPPLLHSPLPTQPKPQKNRQETASPPCTSLPFPWYVFCFQQPSAHRENVQAPIAQRADDDAGLSSPVILDKLSA